jgi:hypothetical protein
VTLKLIEGLVKQPSIKYLLHKQMHGFEWARNDPYIHASDLMKDLEYCPREEALLEATNTGKKDHFIGTAQRATFDHGKDMEKRFRNEWLRPLIVGFWECGVCGNKPERFGKAPKQVCKVCGWGHQWMYREPRILSEDSGISGGIDGLIDVGEATHRLIEIKSMDKDMFKELKGPLAEHRFRTSLYLQLIAEVEGPWTGKVNTKIGHVIYVSKSFGFKDDDIEKFGLKDARFSPFKEYLVKSDPSLSETSIGKARALTYYRKTKGKEGLPCGVCTNVLTKRAQKCQAKQFCWTGKFPATISWPESGKIRHPGKKVP